MNAGNSCTFDIKIINASLYDGTGTPPLFGELGIRDGQIVAFGEASGSAVETLDVDGRAVAPGFIDIHTHYDAQVILGPYVEHLAVARRHECRYG